MAGEHELRIFHVTGTGEFPWDMLRYDACWPWNETESYKLNPIDPYAQPRVVTLATRNPHAPTLRRWASFTWQAAMGAVE